jgi:uncharacterized protein YlxW (UPF0749 family)
MNLVGKIFIVLITFMSITFMSFALAVYATHQNWRLAVENTEPGQGRPLGLKPQLEEAKKKFQGLSDEHEKLKTEIAAEKLAQRQVLAKLEAQRDELVTKRDELQKERDSLNEKDQQSVAALETTSQTLKKLTTEVEGLRKEIRTTQEERDKQFKQVVDTTDNLHQLTNELKRVKEREQQVAGQYAKLKAVAAKLNWTGIEEVSDLHGKILAINGNELVEVSIGSHDGLKVGSMLEVFRGSNYLGRLEVVRLDSNRAVGKVLREFKHGTIQKGDDVASRLKLG